MPKPLGLPSRTKQQVYIEDLLELIEDVRVLKEQVADLVDQLADVDDSGDLDPREQAFKDAILDAITSGKAPDLKLAAVKAAAAEGED